VLINGNKTPKSEAYYDLVCAQVIGAGGKEGRGKRKKVAEGGIRRLWDVIGLIGVVYLIMALIHQKRC